MDFKTPPRRKKPKVSEQGIEQPQLANPINPVEQQATEDPVIELDMDIDPGNESAYKIKPMKRRRLTKRKKIILIGILCVLFCAFAFYMVFGRGGDTPQAQNQTAPQEPVEQGPPKSPLTGEELTNPSYATWQVTGMMVENSINARPQSGLIDAGIVYEAVAEGGVTRFMAVYQEDRPKSIGPIRSARPYYLDFILPYNGSYGHVGGSPEALRDIKNLGVKDLDQFFNAGGYERISSRPAPHNVYTSAESIDRMNKERGYKYEPFTGFERKDDVPQTAKARVIDLELSGPTYNPRFEYSAGKNVYKRFQGGEAHIDQTSGNQISPKSVVVLVMNKNSGGYYSDYKTTGAGKLYVFQDGIVSIGTWSKKDRKSPLVLTDKNGLPMKLNAGQTWVTLVGSPADVNYKQ